MRLCLTSYREVPKFSDARKLRCNLPKIQTKRPNLRVFCQNDANGIVNSEDPDQTAPLVWGNTTHANLTRLVKLQKRAAQIILKADFLTPSEQLFKKLNWLTFPKRVQYHTCLMVYKGINGSAPEYISSMLTYVSEKHERHTRSTALDLLHIPRTHTSFFDRAFSVQGPKLWNSLPADIRNSPTVNRFKSALKRYLLINS